MVGHPGFEPRTFALKGRCSTSWANNPFFSFFFESRNTILKSHYFANLFLTFLKYKKKRCFYQTYLFFCEINIKNILNSFIFFIFTFIFFCINNSIIFFIFSCSSFSSWLSIDCLTNFHHNIIYFFSSWF